MNTKLTRNGILLSVILGGVISCGKSPETSKSDKIAPQPTPVLQQESKPPPKQPLDQMKTSDPKLPLIADLSAIVSGARIGKQGRDAVIAMHQLLQQWTPVGKGIADVESMLGKPSEENELQLVYRFDDGDQAYEWTLPIQKNVVISITKVLHE